MPPALSLLASVWLATAAPHGPGPTLAVEDTLHTQVPPVLVRAPRVTLDEILARVARGEAHRDSLMQDQSFVATVRIVRDADDGNHAPALETESVYKVFRKRPDHVRALLLRRWEAHPKKSAKTSMGVRFGPSMSEQLVNFAFRPEARHEFRYAIVGRDLVGGHLIYRLQFAPRSLLDPSMPHGLVWVDTNDFVILRQEVGFDRPPAPPLFEGVDRMVIERTQVDGYWVLHRAMMRARTGLPLPHLGRSFDLSLTYGQYAINRGVPDSVFTARVVTP